MKLVSTNIGPFSVDLLKDTVSGIVDVFVLPLANSKTPFAYVWKLFLLFI